MSIMKTGSASTLDIIKGVRGVLANIKGQLPPQLQINALSDQSIFVRGAINGVVREALIAACLTAIMILIFLGSFRSTVIIAVSIPLSILCSLIVLYMLHETINIMTLGGLALAVGILVDDATVEIENINRNLESGKEIEQAILDGAAQIATPGAGFDAGHLHRVCAHVSAERRGALPVCAAGGGGGVRHAGQLPALAHRGAHHGQVPAQGARRRGDAEENQPQSVRPLSAGLRIWICENAQRLPAAADAVRRLMRPCF
jgi:ribosomal protein L12E/L44/L45/RPP1/RPP2